VGWKERNKGGSRVNGYCKNSIRWTEMLPWRALSMQPKHYVY